MCMPRKAKMENYLAGNPSRRKPEPRSIELEYARISVRARADFFLRSEAKVLKACTSAY